jgi:hypothetical protein
MRKTSFPLLAPATAVALPIFSEQVGGTKPSFEVASVKPSAAGDIRTYGPRPGGRFIATSATLKTVIAVAWDVPEYQISGDPIGLGRTDGMSRPGLRKAVYLREWGGGPIP